MDVFRLYGQSLPGAPFCNLTRFRRRGQSLSEGPSCRSELARESSFLLREIREQARSYKGLYNFIRFRRRAFVITDTELKLMAAAAIIGLSRMPKNGNSTPAATGTPMAL